MNRLSGPHNDSTTTFAFEFDLGGIAAGAYLGVDLEVVYVWDADKTAKTATVQRAMLGSTKATHGDDAIVRVNPIHTDFAIARALNQELISLSGEGLFQMKALDVTYSSTVQGYDLTGVTDILEIYELHWKQTGTNKLWPEIRNYDLTRNMATSEFASGKALFIYERAGVGNPIRVRYKAPFGTLSNTTDNISSVTGLHAEAHDIPPLGAAARLLAPMEARRNYVHAQGNPKKAEDVPSGGILRSSQAMLGLRQKRVGEERSRLYQMFPPKF